MLIKDQIRSRRESLGLSMQQLADRVGLTEQAIRHWESGRSFPGKSKMAALEQALSFTLDWTEGRNAEGQGKTAASMVDQGDIELVLVIARLPQQAKTLIGDLARMHLEAVDRARSATPPPAPAVATPSPAPMKKSRARKAVGA